MTAIYAEWDISLDVECPICSEYFDLTSNCDFWVDSIFECCEHDTPATKGVDVECPACKHEFKVDFRY